MFVCNDCSSLFADDQIETAIERHGFEYGNFETFSVCPYCKSTNFDERSCDSEDFEEDWEKEIVRIEEVKNKVDVFNQFERIDSNATVFEKYLIKENIDLSIKVAQLNQKVRALQNLLDLEKVFENVG